MSGPVTAVLSLGSNLGDSRAILADAVARLAATRGVHLRAVSSLYATPPWGGVAQPDFFNAVVMVDTDLAPTALLQACQAIEQAHHRTREVRWGPRTLDLDVITYGDTMSDDPTLTLPHPRAAERAFVLLPWREVDADAVLPGVGSVAELAVNDDGVTVVAGPAWAQREPRDG